MTETPIPVEQAALLDVEQLATMLGCSDRHIWRLRDLGRLPPPVKLGWLVRWNRAAIAAWIAAGCPDCRKPGGR